MIRPASLIFYYHRHNRYGINALAGSIGTDESLNETVLEFPQDENGLFGAITRLLQGREKVMVAFSLFSMQTPDIERLVHRLRRSFGPKVVCIAGGPHATGDPEGTIEMGFDIAVVGEGEETIRELIKVVTEGGDIARVKGIAFRDSGGSVARTPRRRHICLDSYPPFGVRHEKFGPIELTRGCPFGCSFCQATRIMGPKPRHRSIESVVEYVALMRSRNMRDIRFSTPDAFAYGSEDGRILNPEAVERLLRSLRDTVGPKGKIYFGSFPAEIRPEHVTEELVDLVVAYANNDNLVFGAQSGSARMLDLCRRGHTSADVCRAVGISVRKGFKTYVDFIFGLPGETHEDALESVRLVRELISMGARPHIHAFMPLPGTPFGRSAPAPLSSDIRKALNSLISSGEVFGNWAAQQRMAERMAGRRK